MADDLGGPELRLTPDRLQVLLDHGLSDYQARVYLALLDFPSLSAGALAKAAQVPRNRLYEVLEELHAMGLVDILLEESRKYRAQPISKYLDRSLGDLKERIRGIEAQKSYLDMAFRPPALGEAEDLEAGATRVILTRRSVAREIDRLVENGAGRLVCAGSVGGWERIFRHLDRFPATRDRAEVEVILPRIVQQSGGVERLAEGWDHAIRWIEAPMRSLAFVSGEQELLLVHPVPDDDRPRVGRDFGLLTTNPAFVRDHLELLRAASRTAVPAE